MFSSFEESEFLGSAYVNGLITYNRNHSEMAESSFQLLTGRPLSYENFPISPKDLNDARSRISSIPEETLSAYIKSSCSVRHEITHIRQASSSTACLWLSLRYRQMFIKLSSFLESISTKRVKQIYQPLKEYLIDEGLQSRSKHIKQFAAYYNSFLTEYNIFTGNHIVSMKDLFELDNVSYKELFYTDLDMSLPSSPYKLTFSHLIEAESRIEDYNIIRICGQAGAKESILTKMAKELYIPGYIEAFHYFNSKMAVRDDLNLYQKHILYKLSIDLSLFPPLIYSLKSDITTQKWEDIQPCWRFCLIIERLKDMSIPTDPFIHYHSLMNNICDYYKWISPISQAQSILLINTDRMTDKLEKELLDRHIIYCKILTDPKERWRLFYSDFGDISLSRRFEPWIKYDDNMLWFDPRKDDDEKRTLFCYSLRYFVYEELLYSTNFDNSWDIFKKFNRPYLDSGQVSESELKNDFNDTIKQITNYPPQRIVIR